MGRGEDIPICKHKVEEAQKEMKEDEWHNDEKLLDFTEDEYDKIFSDRKLYEFQGGKAAGPDGWTQEAARAIINCDNKANEDYKQLMKTCLKFEVIPKWNKRAKVKPAKKPGKNGNKHNDWRKLTLMSIWKKKIGNAMDFSARNLTRTDGSEHWTPGAYQGGFMKKKSTHGRIFIVYTTIQSAKDR